MGLRSLIVILMVALIVISVGFFNISPFRKSVLEFGKSVGVISYSCGTPMGDGSFVIQVIICQYSVNILGKNITFAN